MPMTMESVRAMADFGNEIRKFLAREVRGDAPYFSTSEVAIGTGVSVRKVTDKMNKGPFDHAMQVGRNWVFSTPKHLKVLREKVHAK